VNRRSFIGIFLGAAAALTLRAARTVEPEVATWNYIPLGNQLSYLTRRSYLATAYTQIYNTSSLLVGLLADGKEI
jgi:hypothetical protein